MLKLIVNANPSTDEQGRSGAPWPNADEAAAASLKRSDDVFRGFDSGTASQQSAPTDQGGTTNAAGEPTTARRASYGEALAWAVQNDPDVRTVESSQAAAALSAVRLIAGVFQLPLELVSIDVWSAASFYETFQRVGAHEAATRFLAAGCRGAGPLIEEVYAPKA